ncbi:hypothetical protein NL676_020906 [Syzygium grande]|nr:hypothetical protein NL676_020906 [Syzygium grande]
MQCEAEEDSQTNKKLQEHSWNVGHIAGSRDRHGNSSNVELGQRTAKQQHSQVLKRCGQLASLGDFDWEPPEEGLEQQPQKSFSLLSR